MTRENTFNFSAGPSVLSTEVLQRASAELLNYQDSGMSVMEMSHRSKVFEDIFAATKAKFKAALSVPDSHEILFLQGGASTQFSAVPLNLLGDKDTADYAVTGNFSGIAAKEGARYCKVNLAATSEDRNHTYIPAQAALKLNPDAAYFHYCANNTIFGTAWKYIPETGNVPLACDMSSEILSKPVDVSRYGVIYAGAQKNMAPSGLTVVIVDKSLVGHERPHTPMMLGYELMVKTDSMYNTLPCYNIYLLGLTLDWLDTQGGVKGMKAIKSGKAALLYNYLDESGLFSGCAEREARSDMNVTFRTGNEELDAAFVKEATARGFLNLKGHRVAGGMRASIYNAMPVEGVERLVAFMKEFEVKHHV